MKLLATRCLPISVFLLLLTGFKPGMEPHHEPTDESVRAYRQIEQSLASGQLEKAQRDLQEQLRNNPQDTRGHSLQQQLAEAYVRQGQASLQQGNLDGATQALNKAKQIQPNSQASQALATAISAKQQALQAEAELARQQADALARQQAQERAQQQARANAARQQAALAAEQAAAAARQAAEQKRPRLIDPSAPSSVIEMPMLDQKDNNALRQLMDSVAHDVVTYNCAVRIEVREAKDYQWTAALLSARIKRLDPQFEPSLLHSIEPNQSPRLVLTPAN